MNAWSVFEPWYQAHTECLAPLPTFSVRDLQYFDPEANEWALVKPQMSGFATVANHGGKNGCFNGDKARTNYISSTRTTVGT